jgi:hypothetical protein
MKIKVLSCILLGLLVLTPCFSHALEISKNGSVVMLKGPIVAGDEYEFKNFINDPSNASIKIVRLHSTGGKVIPARDIGRLIRSKNLTTLVDAKSDNCASACTLLFGAGVNRHYTNASNIKDGVYGFKELTVGLGYHEGNTPTSLDKNRYSGQATADMIAGYYEFGVKNAKDIITLAPPNKLYRVSSQTALQLGIATSLAAP